MAALSRNSLDSVGHRRRGHCQVDLRRSQNRNRRLAFFNKPRPVLPKRRRVPSFRHGKILCAGTGAARPRSCGNSSRSSGAVTNFSNTDLSTIRATSGTALPHVFRLRGPTSDSSYQLRAEQPGRTVCHRGDLTVSIVLCRPSAQSPIGWIMATMGSPPVRTQWRDGGPSLSISSIVRSRPPDQEAPGVSHQRHAGYRCVDTEERPSFFRPGRNEISRRSWRIPPGFLGAIRPRIDRVSPRA